MRLSRNKTSFMKSFFKHLHSFLTNNSLWIFMVLLLFFGFILTLLLNRHTISGYLYIGGMMWVTFAPVLLFSAFRNYLKSILPIWVFVLIWGLCFLIYPLSLAIIRVFVFEDWAFLPKEGWFLDQYFALLVGFFMLLTEIGLQLFNKREFQSWMNRFFSASMLEPTILLVLLLIAVIFSFANLDNWAVDNQEATRFRTIAVFFSFTIQYCIIFLCYYFFYFINHYYLIPQLLKPRGVLHYGFGMAGTILLFYPIWTWIIFQLPITSALQINGFNDPNKLFPDDGGGIPFIIMVLTAPLIVSLKWFQQNHQIIALEKEKSATELSLLKQQINPHFFFNTLNNLYALSIKKDPATPETIMQLSEMMRYVIYRGKNNLVKLSEEIKYIEDYINLQSIRLHKKLDFSLDKKEIDEDTKVPPLLFIILVENAFKHGIEPAERSSYLHLKVESNNEEISFSCTNSVECYHSKTKGIGLQNLQRRLALLYPNQHQLQLNKADNSFTAHLKIFQ